MLTSTAKNTNDLSVDKALKRMLSHANKSKSSFAKSLKVKAPSATYGRLAGPPKA
ncbi:MULTISPECIES: hypothetical protein [Vibrio]|uniref:Uncharacterized protein n=2 Tax=Vibrio TaxID=662 RepID=A0AAJ4I8L7_9VIBR|nr:MULTISPECIES: hypothetical protein [Vibrio]MBT2920463.1 hypothetical protein [Vibrio anguillarum]QPL52365.1 hypothetical protein I3X05_10010 [Vibrio navarrensis]